MKCSVYIATSVDGFIAKPNGNVDWLHIAIAFPNDFIQVKYKVNFL
jgi:hypothetical protein